VEKSLVKPKRIEEAKLAALRPRDSSLNTVKARELGLAFPSIHECLKDMIFSYRGSAESTV
jgi:dTDP-4-dehydrorhamnose reductase